MVEKQNPPRRTMRLTHFWGRHGWLVIGLLWTVSLVLGFIGFKLNAAVSARSDRFFDVAFRVVQLISMDSGDVDGAGWQLNIARFLIPVLALWTAIRALLSVFRDYWQLVLLRFWRHHVVICGLSRKGWLLAQGFVARGDRVVVIEANEAHDLIRPCREHGIVVLIGDATDPDLLRRAGIVRAHHLVAVTDDDGANVEIAVRAQDLIKTLSGKRYTSAYQRTPLTCTAHLVDPQLYQLVRTRELTLEAGIPFRLELFNVFDRGARLLWNEFGPVTQGNDGKGNQPADEKQPICSPSVLIIGLGRMGESLAVYAARDWHTRLHDHPCRATGRLRITVIDLEAGWKCKVLGLRYPQMAEVCDIIPVTMNVCWPEFYEGTFLTNGADCAPMGAIFVCFDEDSLALRTGLAIGQRLMQITPSRTPVVVRMVESEGLARLVDSDQSGMAHFANIHTFGLLDRTCTPESIVGGTHEVLAQGLHEAYIQRQKSIGQTAETNPSIVEWDQLPEALRESNRAQADAIYRHLSDLGYALVPLTDWDAASFRFTETEVPLLAEKEHTRFVAERRSKGWRYANGTKSIEAMLSPALVDWSQLPEEERVKTCEAVRKLPITLARAGFQIIRLASANQAAPLDPTDEKMTMNAPADRNEILAQVIHARYRVNQQGTKPPDDPAMQPWEQLPEPLRESNRRQAENIAATLDSIGCGVRPAAHQAPVHLDFTADEIETMAALAHDHWVEERRKAGWVPGEVRDVARKITPYLELPYNELPEDVKEWDRQAVRAIPEALAAAGLEVYRIK